MTHCKFVHCKLPIPYVLIFFLYWIQEEDHSWTNGHIVRQTDCSPVEAKMRSEWREFRGRNCLSMCGGRTILWCDCCLAVSETLARMGTAYHKTPWRLSDHNRCSFWHESAPFPCLLLCGGSWNRLLSWPGEACKVILHLVLVPITMALFWPHILILWHLSGGHGMSTSSCRCPRRGCNISFP